MANFYSSARRLLSRLLAPLLYAFSITLGIFSLLLLLGLLGSFVEDAGFISGPVENVIAALLLGASVLVWRGGLRLHASAAEEALEDCRPPVLYIRSFADDDRRTGAQGEDLVRFVPKPRLEEQLTRALSVLGPVIAIGMPEEKLPALGAARMYVGDSWQKEVLALHKAAQLVLVQAGTGAGLLWELRQFFQVLGFKPVLLCFPPREGGGAPDECQYRYFKSLIEEQLSVKLPEALGDAHFIWFSSPYEGILLKPLNLKSGSKRPTLLGLAFEAGPLGVGGPGFSGVWPILDHISPGASAKMRIINGGRILAIIAVITYVLAIVTMSFIVVGYFDIRFG